jgi:carboxyl-terminal processing protease
VYRRPSRLPALLIGALVALLALLGGIWLGGHPSDLPGPIRDTFTADKDTRLMREALDTIDELYYRKIPRSQLLNKGIAGAVSSLKDPFSHYFDPTTYKQFQHTTNPSFSGIGVTVRGAKQGLAIESVIAGTPASHAGLRPGDLIVAVGASRLLGRPESYAIGLIKGRPGTKVTLTIQRDGRRTVRRIARAQVTQPVVASRIVRRNGVPYGVVVYASFTAQSSDQVRAAVRRLLARGAKGIVLDLRGNGGGLLDEAVAVASIFIPDGTIVSTAGRVQPRHVYTASGDPVKPAVPLVVLVDRGTASAAEIVTGALRDRHRARVVGTRTFGKGVFQEVRNLPNGGALDLTVGQYFLPNGENIGGKGVAEGKGIAPEVRAQDDPKTLRQDEALDVALRTLAAQPR